VLLINFFVNKLSDVAIILSSIAVQYGTKHYIKKIYTAHTVTESLER